jgi:hypothetical protein
MESQTVLKELNAASSKTRWRIIILIFNLWIQICRGADTQINQFLAYDCSKPYDIKDVSYSEGTHCVVNSKIDKRTNITYQVLQKERYRTAPGWSCSVTRTQTVHYCGVYDHQTYFGDRSYYNIPHEITTESCRRMWKELFYFDPMGNRHDVWRNKVNSIYYSEKGNSYLSGGEISCTGEDYVLPDSKVVVHQAQVSVHLVITLQEEKFQYDETGVTVHKSQIKLPCEIEREKCATATATYLWEMPADKCPLAVVNVVTGLEVTNTAEQKVFMSLDGSLTRYILKDTEPECERIVIGTNAPGWYLYPTTSPKPFTRHVDPGTISSTDLAMNRDDYLFNYLADAIQQEYGYVLASDCRRQGELDRLSYWIQLKNPGATTWLVSEDIFGTSSGEVIYQYRCNPVPVIARETPVCYQALPVERIPTIPDRKTSTTTETPSEDIIAAGIETLDDRPLFMEPLTRRLTHQGIEIPCVSKFASKWKNVNDGWMSHLKSLHSSNPPQLPSDLGERRLHALDPKNRPQAGQGGLYKQEDIDAMERYMDLPRATTALGVNLVGQANLERLDKGPLNPEDLFPNFQDPRKWMQGLWGRFVTFLHEWGEAASVLVSIYIIVKLGILLFGWGYNLFILRDIHGCGRILCWVPFISYFLMRTYRDSPYGMEARAARVQRRNQKIQDKATAKGTTATTTNNEGYLPVNQIAPPNEYSNPDSPVIDSSLPIPSSPPPPIPAARNTSTPNNTPKDQ